MSTTLEHLQQSVGALRSPTRNRYFYGKLLDAHHFRIEQDYVNQMRWLMNRLSLGTGVLCGLQVSVDSEKHLARIAPGVAVDGFGREIIVPQPTAPFDFIALARSGQTVTVGPHLPSTAPAGTHVAEIVVQPKFTILLCYHECCAEPTPVLVTDECAPERRCEHGLVRERYSVKVLPGVHMPPPNGFPDPLCRIFTSKMSRDQRLAALCKFRPPIRHPNGATGSPTHEVPVGAGDCSPPDEICVPIAVLVQAGNGWVVKPCPPPRLLFSNEVLFEMILCLADCCAGHDDTTTHALPNIERLDPPAGIYDLSNTNDLIARAWGWNKKNDTWSFSVTFNQKMADADVNIDPSTWLRPYLIIPASQPATHAVPPAAWAIRMGLKVEQGQAQVGTSGKYEAKYRITVPAPASATNAEVKELFNRLTNGIPVGDGHPRFRFAILMHSQGVHALDASGALLNVANDGVGGAFDAAGGVREKTFNNVAPEGSAAQFPFADVMTPAPAGVDTPPTPAEEKTDTWFSSVLDFITPDPIG
jgi:hypothetical protein